MTGSHTVRQRAPKACLRCRSLKAKCEIDPNLGDICVRCKRDETPCVFVATRRGIHNRRKLVEKEQNILVNTKTEQNIPRKSKTDIPAYHESNPELLYTDQSSIYSEPAISPSQSNTSHDELSTRIINNPADSLDLLARTAFDNTCENQIIAPEIIAPEDVNIQNKPNDQTSFTKILNKFCLVEQGIIGPIELKSLVSTFFTRHHQYMPVLPTNRISKTDEELCTLVETEPYLVMTFIIIASRFENIRIHDASWSCMSRFIQDLVLGVTKPTLGAIESLLLLSENIPRCPEIHDRDLHEFEERCSWNLIGQAVRMSYYMGLDQKTLLENDEEMNEETHRMRLIWTYCYFQERQSSIRFGKAFLTRGPTLCFPSSYVNSRSGREAYFNFPTLIPSVNSLEDYASYTQALIDTTNLLSTTHDLLYPSRDRTISLVHQGDYVKILDELTMGFATFKITWEQKQWRTLALNETVWISFHYAKLYAYGFAFQAHMKRASDASDDSINAQSMFPKSLSATQDAKFIIEAKNAARKILEICVNDLHRYGAMAYLPGRYYGYFSHAAVFLIKIVFTGATNFEEQKNILNLIRMTISCICNDFQGADKHHPLIRYAQQLRTLMQTLWSAKGVDFGDIVDLRLNNQLRNGQLGFASEPFDSEFDTSLANDVRDLVDSFSLDQFDSEYMRQSAEAALRDLTASFSNDLNSDLWLAYFNQTG